MTPPLIIPPSDAEDRPTLIVGHGWDAAELPLGLDRPLDLLGGDGLAPARFTAELALDWAPDSQNAVAEACRLRSIAGRRWFGMPPSVLTGRPGIGRALAVRRLARLTGLPLLVIDVSGPAGASHMRATVAAPIVAFCSTAVLAMAATRCANPIVLVTGVDEADPTTLDLLRSAADPVSSRRWSEPTLGATVDLGEVSWIFVSSSPMGPPRQLRGFRRIDFAIDPEDDLSLRCRELTALSEAMEDAGIDARSLRGREAQTLEALATTPEADAGRLALAAAHLLNVIGLRE